MPRIDPAQLLKTLGVLLAPHGGIKSSEEVAIRIHDSWYYQDHSPLSAPLHKKEFHCFQLFRSAGSFNWCKSFPRNSYQRLSTLKYWGPLQQNWLKISSMRRAGSCLISGLLRQSIPPTGLCAESCWTCSPSVRWRPPGWRRTSSRTRPPNWSDSSAVTSGSIRKLDFKQTR